MLVWPEETLSRGKETPSWSHAGTNLCLDFHGDPRAAQLAVFSDGNHHMALIETLERFSENNPEVEEVFYATTPPGPIVELLGHGSLRMGNLTISVTPHVFISPPNVLDTLAAQGYIEKHEPFMKNRGNVLLVPKGNPKSIGGVKDLASRDIRLFLSNPKTEAVSCRGYLETLRGMARREGINPDFLKDASGGPVIVYGERIHHREAPEAVYAGKADVAVIYYHLALRYVRIFPTLFEIVPLGGTAEAPDPYPENVVSRTHAAVIGDGGHWGRRFLRFLSSDTVSAIYIQHGLQRPD